ncbi:ubiquitin carboxyl-terminal hydrolase 20-like, partial [Stegodyphus dumicola]|uniref:ubiquitin carboxyl-terminal hydrolase 20-like n=1 Tax=Stegodyphus dumicola TaxID=202533 RepID=UPI0015AC495A
WFWGPCITLQDCLSAFFSADELKGDNMYSCDRCKKLRNGVKFSKVIQLPEVLCIHLKRFRHEVMFSSKISNYVSFPLEGLDMSPFLHKGYPQGVTTYDLISVICHHGTAGSGHYTAYCFNNTNEQWYEFDDQYVTAVDDEVVKHCEAYVLFYRKSNEGMRKKRDCAINLINCARVEKGLLVFNVSRQWIIKFNKFAEPGPITNSDFLCTHGGVPPDKVSCVRDLCSSVPQAVWEYLYETFGGGPPSTHLYICPICQDEQDLLHSKRKTELDEFTMMNCEFHEKKRSPIVYALSMSWFKTWENFICKDDDPPGPIDNSSICCVKNNQAVLKYGSDYCSISEKMYAYLKGIYGGGPDVAVQSNANVIPSPSSTRSSSSGHSKSSSHSVISSPSSPPLSSASGHSKSSSHTVIPSPSSSHSSASGHSKSSSHTGTGAQIVSVHTGCRQTIANLSQPSPSARRIFDKDESSSASEAKTTSAGEGTDKVDDSIGN